MRFHWGRPNNKLELQTKDRRLLVIKDDRIVDEFPGAVCQRLQLKRWFGFSWKTRWFLGFQTWENLERY